MSNLSGEAGHFVSAEDAFSDPLETAGVHLGGHTVREMPQSRATSPEAQPVQMNLLDTARSLGEEAMQESAQIQPAAEESSVSS